MDEKTLLRGNSSDDIIKNSLLVENFIDQEKIFACGKISSKRKNLCSRKTSLIKETFLFVEKFPYKEKIFACKKLPCKNLGLWKTSIRKEKSLVVENFFDEEKIFACGKEIGQSLLKMKS